jgi:hypothetical protein
MVIAVACLCPGYWLAALCAQEGRPCVLGPALYMQAIPGGKATNDRSAAPKIAVLLRGGLLPQASVSPAPMRAPRALLRRRLPLAHQRAALLAPVQPTHRQYPLPAIGQQIASTAPRPGVAERCAEPAVQKHSAGALALLPSSAELRGDGDRALVPPATPHDATPLSRLQPVPGLGKILRLVRRSALPDIPRFPRGPACVADGRLGQWAKPAAGKRCGTAGATIGKAHLQGAFSAAAVLCLSAQPAAPNDLARVEKKPDTGHALPVLAPTLARAVSAMLHRQGAFDREKVFQRSGRGAEEPDASLDTPGTNRHEARDPA